MMNLSAMLRPAIYLVALLPLSGCRSLETVEVEFPVRLPDPNQVAQIRQQEQQEISGYQPGDLEKPILEAFYKFNLETVKPDPTRSDQEDAIKAIRMGSKMCLEQGGQTRLRKLILWMLVRFEQSLKDLVGAATTQEVTRALLSGSPPPDKISESYGKFVELGGDFLSNAYNAGLLQSSPQGGVQLAPGGDFFIRLAFKVRWAKILPEATQPMTWLLSGFEREWYDVWTVERSKTAPLTRKLQAIARLKKKNPAYQDHAARGIVYYQHQEYARSVRSFEQASRESPQDPKLQSYLQAARRHLR